MPPPPNTTPALATVMTLPYTATLDVSEASAPLHEVWYVYTAATADRVIGFWASATVTSVYVPETVVFTGSAGSLTPYLAIATVNTPVQLPVTPSQHYYFRVRNTGTTEPLDAPLAVSLLPAPSLAVPAGAILVNDDADGFPLAVLSPTDGTVVQFRLGFPAGERGAILTNGISCWQDLTGAVTLYDAALTQLARVAWVTAFEPPISSNRINRFYLGKPAGGGGVTPAIVTTLSSTGVFGPTTWTLPTNGLLAMAPSLDETVLYHTGQSTSVGSTIERWNLLTHTVLTPLAGNVAGYAGRKELLVLADGSLLAGYYKGVAPVDAFVRHYAPDGTVLHTYPLGAQELNRLAYAIDDPLSFWVWIWGRGALDGVSIFQQIRVSDGTVLASLNAAQYELGIYEPATLPPSARFGHSFSCPFVMLPPSLAPPDPNPGTTTRIRRVRRAPHLSAEQAWQFFSKFQLDFEPGVGSTGEPGVDPQITLRWSDDGGHSWHTPLTVSAGLLGEYKRRAIWRRLGRGRDRVFEIIVDDPVKWALVAAYLEAQKGTS